MRRLLTPITGFYLGAHFGKSLFWHASELLFAFFLSEMCSLSIGTVGTLLALSLLANAVSDALIGRFLTHSVCDLRSSSRVQLVGAIASAVMFLMIALVGLLPQALRVSVALIGLFGFRLTYSFYDVPQNAILAFATDNEKDGARLSALRYVFGGLANLLIASSFVSVFLGQAPQKGVVAFALLASVFSGVAVLSALLLYFHSKYRGGARPNKSECDKLPASYVLPLPILFLVIAGFALYASTSVFSRLEPYVASYAFGAKSTGAGLVMAASLGNLLSQPVWAFVSERASLRAAQRASAAVLVIGAVSFSIMANFGAFHAGFSGFFYGVGAGGLMMCLWARLASTSHRWPRLTTTVFGAFTMCTKTGIAFSALGLGWVMAGFDYRSVTAPLVILMGVVPVIGTLLALGLVELSLLRRREIGQM